ncbi:hypothetical protein AMJ49_03310 [Parcubacteria bacterium DG_74_2]|nr:MAG: hypothetical protein AMJ49_03310 [Parcubacteria bacterium DG_74_2]
MKFCQYQKPILISLSPNTEKDDIDLSLKMIFKSKEWKEGSEVQELEEEFKKYLEVNYVFSFNSGRSALMAILDALGIKEDDEILLQGFTCNSAVIPILAKKAKPVYVDINETLNLDAEDLSRRMTPKSKVVMIQHTFGWPAKIDEISEIAKKNNLYLIEDCAHSLGAKYKGKFCGTFGDAAFFSFGRDKIVSSVYGGMAVTNDEKLAEKIKNFQERLNFPSNFWIFQQLLHPILTNYLILPLYDFFDFGRFLLIFLQKLNILSKAVHNKEKRGKIPGYFPKKFSNALAILAKNQFKKLERFNEHRRKIAKIYENELKRKFNLPLLRDKREEELTPLRYPILVKNSDKILREMEKNNIHLNDGWRKSPVVPPDTDFKKMEYIKGSCERAENLADHILNLPTHINVSEKKVREIINILKKLCHFQSE